ncbi:hypothetical protein CRUP_031612, partial [Coryphaenoides rupestris]
MRSSSTVDGCTRVSVVMGHAVEEVEVLGEADPQTARRLSSLFRPEEQEEALGGREEVQRRRAALIGWLQQNRVPVEQDGEELLVARVLRVRPPYGRQDCLSSNHMVLDRIQALLDRMPPGPCDQPHVTYRHVTYLLMLDSSHVTKPHLRLCLHCSTFLRHSSLVLLASSHIPPTELEPWGRRPMMDPVGSSLTWRSCGTSRELVYHEYHRTS